MAPHRPEDEEDQQAQSNSWSAVNYLMRSGLSWSGSEQNTAYLNTGNGFADISWLSGFGYLDDARGAILIDWDGDGDLDLFANNRSSPRLRYLRNNYDGPNGNLQLKLVATNGNRDAVGARVTVDQGHRRLVRTVRNGVNYEAQNSRVLHFGLGEQATVEGVNVRWPDGSTTTFNDLRSGGRYTLVQGEASPRPWPAIGAQKPLVAKIENHGAGGMTGNVPLGTPIPVPGRIGLTSFDGKRYDLESLRGQPVLINLWASWCGGCKVELTDWIENKDVLKATGVRILAATVDTPEDKHKAIEMASDMGFYFPAGMCDEDLLNMTEVIKKVVLDNYQDMPLPSSFLIDAQGRLRRMYRGPVEPAQIAADIRAMQAANTPSEILASAADAHGRWYHADFWADNQNFSRLLRLADFAYQEGEYDLAADYGIAVAGELQTTNRLESAVESAFQKIGPIAYKLSTRLPDRSVDLYRALLAVRPRNVDLQLGLVGALVQQGSPESRQEAATKFTMLLAELPEPEDAQRASIYGNTLLATGQHQQALGYLKMAVEFDPDDPTLRAALGSALIDHGDLEEGIEEFSTALASLPPSGVNEAILGRALDRAGKPEQAVEHFEKVLQLLTEPQSVREHLALGTAAFRLGRWDVAARNLSPVVQANPQSVRDRLTFGLALANMGQSQPASDHLEWAVPRAEPDAENYFYLGITRARLGQFAPAEEALRKAIEINPQHQGARRSIAMVLEGQGQDATKTIQAYRDYLTSWPEDIGIRHRLATVYEMTGSPSNAAEQYRTIIANNPDEVESRFRLGWILATTNDDALRDGETARQIAQALVEQFGDAQPLPYDLLAAAQATSGSYEAAVESINKAIQIATTNNLPEIVEQLEKRKALYTQNQPYREGN